MLDPHATHLSYLPLDPAPPLPLPTLPLGDGKRVIVLGSLAGLAQQAQQQQGGADLNGSGPPEAGAGGGFPLEQLRLFELDVRTFTAGSVCVETC